MGFFTDANLTTPLDESFDLLTAATVRSSGQRWQDIDFDNGKIMVWHRKCAKRHEVPPAGERAQEALRAGQMCQEIASDCGYLPGRLGDQVGMCHRFQSVRPAAGVHLRGADH